MYQVKQVIKAIERLKNGEPIPEPIASKRYSGKFMIRVPPEEHRKLALEAAESGVSLNRLASTKLCSNSALRKRTLTYCDCLGN